MFQDIVHTVQCTLYTPDKLKLLDTFFNTDLYQKALIRTFNIIFFLQYNL